MMGQIEQHYGAGKPIQALGFILLEYGDSSTVCYISEGKSLGNDLITVRVGNRIFWDPWIARFDQIYL